MHGCEPLFVLDKLLLIFRCEKDDGLGGFYGQRTCVDSREV